MKHQKIQRIFSGGCSRGELGFPLECPPQAPQADFNGGKMAALDHPPHAPQAMAQQGVQPGTWAGQRLAAIPRISHACQAPRCCRGACLGRALICSRNFSTHGRHQGVAEALALAEFWLVSGISLRTPKAQGMQRRGFHTLDSVRLSGRPGFRGTRPVRTCQAHPGDCQFLAI